MMHRNRSVNTHAFAMVPRADIPRASFTMQKAYKTTFDSGFLIPMFCEEILPGDSFRVKMTAFARLATPIFPVMDNLHLDTFFFFVPNRLVWSNWMKLMGEQDNPSDSISFTVPLITSAPNGFAVGSLYDYFGLPTVGQVAAAASITINAMPLRAYNLIWNEWFRDQNLQNSVLSPLTDGPDPATNYVLLRRGKRHDYFTSCLPWPQKGGVSVQLPLGTTAPVISNNTSPQITTLTSVGAHTTRIAVGTGVIGQNLTVANQNIPATVGASMVWAGANTGLVADLSAATAATINQLRQSFQVQKMLERDARGGTRYTEIVRSHFGVISPDARLQRPEYLGGGTAAIVLNPVAQTSASTVTGSTTALGNLAAVGTMIAHGHGFSQSFTEHGYVIGLMSVRADLSYQQGARRHWFRRTRFDFYFPAFAMLGEQPVFNREIYMRGDAADVEVFGYQERWAEYRYSPSEVTGLFKSTSAGTIDAWHLSQRFTSLPLLNSAFISETPPLSRILAVGAAANGAQLIFDSVFDMKVARPMPLYSVPGLIDHF